MRPILSALILSGCLAAPHAESPTRPVLALDFRIADEWPSIHRAFIADGIGGLRLPGVRLRIVPEGGDIIVEHAAFYRCAFRGLYVPVQGPFGARIELDPVCLPGESMWLHVVRHEVLHVLGAQRVCRWAGETADCSPVGYGAAILNPRSLDPAPDFGTEAACCAGGIDTDLSELDIAEVRRALGRR